MNHPWLSLLPAVIAVSAAIWSKKILPSLLLSLIVGSYILKPTISGGLESAVVHIVKTLTDRNNLEVLLFLYLFSGLIALMRSAGGIKAFSTAISKYIHGQRGVFYALWALIPITFIDCGFRIVGAGSIIRPLVKKHSIRRERLAFMLNNTASPVVELIPIATTFVGFNIANIGLGLKAAGISEEQSAYTVLLHAIPYEFFSLVILVLTFSSIFIEWRKPASAHAKSSPEQKTSPAQMMDMTSGEDGAPEIKPRLINLLLPMLTVISMSLFFFGRFKGEANKAMLVALFISLILTGVLYFLQKYPVAKMTRVIISGGNELMTIIAILTLAWALGAVSQELGLSDFVQQQLGTSMPAWSIPISLFALSSGITYFMGSGWAAASLIMPMAISLAVGTGAGIPICVGAVITGGTFGDVTSPVAGMTNMASNVAGADQMNYLKYAGPYNFAALILAALLFLVFGYLGSP